MTATDPSARTTAEDDARPQPSAGEMTLLEHLAELRTRMIRILLALMAGAVVGWFLFPSLLDVLVQPYCDVPAAFRAGPADACGLVATRALEPFSVRIKVALIFGAFITGPVIFYQVWRFIAPGLTPREKRYSAPFVLGSQLMFAAGLLFAYLVIPQGLRILLDFGGERIVPLLSAGEYISFILSTAVAFGLVFELPVLLVFLILIGLVTNASLRRFRPYAYVVIVTVAAVVTPTTDAVTLAFMAVPMVVFYEGSTLAAWFIERRRRRRAA